MHHFFFYCLQPSVKANHFSLERSGFKIDGYFTHWTCRFWFRFQTLNHLTSATDFSACLSLIFATYVNSITHRVCTGHSSPCLTWITAGVCRVATCSEIQLELSKPPEHQESFFCLDWFFTFLSVQHDVSCLDREAEPGGYDVLCN